MQVYKIKTDDDGRELTQHGDISFPCAGYDESFSKFILGEVPWHWHEEIEIVVVYQGATRLEYIGGEIEISCGEGVFVNSNTAHRLTQTGDTDCNILNFVFNPRLLGGPPESRIFREYISPICSNRDFMAMKFSPGIPWQQDLLTQFNKAFEAYTAADPGYEMEVVSALLEFWRIVGINRPDLFSPITDSSTDERRIKAIMKFIDYSYMEKISISQISSIAGISQSECFRLFRRTLKCSPNDYLLRIRLQKASIALSNTDRTIQEIALDSGFNSSAYFTKRFRMFFGTTPKEYRKTELIS